MKYARRPQPDRPHRPVSVVGAMILPFVSCLPLVAQVFGPITQHVEVSLDAPSDTAFGDINEDGTLDLATATWDRVDLRFGRGEGHFAEDGPSVFVMERVDTIALGDLDLDGDLDLVIAGPKTHVRLNLGAGNFATTGQRVGLVSAVDVVLEDLNADGNLDLIASRRGDVATFFGDPSGSLSPGPSLAISGFFPHLAIADLDDDGNLDLIATRGMGDTCAVRLGVGGGRFAATGQEVPVTSNAWSPVIADLDANGTLDLVAAGGMSPECSVRWGVGDGTFEPLGIEVPILGTSNSADVADLNEDGAPDIVAANLWESSVSVRLNNGAGQFDTADQDIPIDSTGITSLVSLDFTFGITLVDVDGDGDPDLTGIQTAGFYVDFVFVGMNTFFGFERGDSNGDASVTIADPIYLLEWIFSGGSPLRCEDTGDSDDDGVLDFLDAIFTLSYLFLGGDAIPMPAGACGADPTPDNLEPCRASCP